MPRRGPGLFGGRTQHPQSCFSSSRASVTHRVWGVSLSLLCPGLLMAEEQGQRMSRPRLLSFGCCLNYPRESPLKRERQGDCPASAFDVLTPSLGTLLWLPAQACYLLGKGKARHPFSLCWERRTEREREPDVGGTHL